MKQNTNIISRLSNSFGTLSVVALAFLLVVSAVAPALVTASNHTIDTNYAERSVSDTPSVTNSSANGVVGYMPDGRLVTGTESGNITVYTANGTHIQTANLTSKPTAEIEAINNSYVAVSTADEIIAYNTTAQSVAWRVSTGGPTKVDWSPDHGPDGLLIGLADGDGIYRLHPNGTQYSPVSTEITHGFDVEVRGDLIYTIKMDQPGAQIKTLHATGTATGAYLINQDASASSPVALAQDSHGVYAVSVNEVWQVTESKSTSTQVTSLSDNIQAFDVHDGMMTMLTDTGDVVAYDRVTNTTVMSASPSSSVAGMSQRVAYSHSGDEVAVGTPDGLRTYAVSVLADSDGDGLNDSNDPYPEHSPTTYMVDRNTSMTPDTVYAEFNQSGNVTLTLEAFNNSTGEYETVSTTDVTLSNASNSTPALVELNVSEYTDENYTEFVLTAHGMDATSTGVFYAGNTASGGAGGGDSNDGLIDAVMTPIMGVPLALILALLAVAGAVVLINRDGPRR